MSEVKEIATAVKSNEIILSDGRIAVVGQFKGKHIAQARRLAGNDQEQFMNALISTVVTIDKKPIVMEDLDEMNGFDVLTLMERFSGFIQAPAK